MGFKAADEMPQDISIRSFKPEVNGARVPEAKASERMKEKGPRASKEAAKAAALNWEAPACVFVMLSNWNKDGVPPVYAVAGSQVVDTLAAANLGECQSSHSSRYYRLGRLHGITASSLASTRTARLLLPSFVFLCSLLVAESF
ncbi:hypothetical protein V7S43_004306 [Phytophthora oleae]|uniref:Uncharacterized protein n=1 Tax=Phytophthora oleae TaxID=2107226 RepID=A0ABD3FZP5_9STRA